MLHATHDTALHLGPFPNHDSRHGVKVSVRDLSVWYGTKQALDRVSLDIYAGEVTAFIGPSGCGKSTLLRCLNRTTEIIDGTRIEGSIRLDGLDIHDPGIDPPLLRKRFGWIAQRPNPFPWSIRTNVLYGARIQGLVDQRGAAEDLIEKSLRAAGLWDEVKDRLRASAMDLSIGQQQRLCIARAIATGPDVILLDEPCSALDPIATAHVENLIEELRASYTVVIITHNLQQAARVAQRVAYFHLGELLEVGDAEQVFLHPRTRRCQDFITGRFG